MNESVGVLGAFDVMSTMEASSQTDYDQAAILSLMKDCGVRVPEDTLQEFLAAGILNHSSDKYALTTLGIRTTILLEAVNGCDLQECYRRLGRIDSSLRTYELVREGMTKTFLRNINQRPGFGRLYFCSPWINLSGGQDELLRHAVMQVEQTRGSCPEILVITRPQERTDLEPPASIEPLRDLGATVFLNKRLHTKLYIREPDRSGGYSMAILGSQNLTRSNYLELGIRINADSRLIDQLIAYFWEITNYSQET